MRRKGLLFTLLLAVSLIGPVAAVRSQATSTNTRLFRPASTTSDNQGLPTGQIIIKFVDGFGQQVLMQQDLDSLMADLSQAAGVPLTYGRPMSGQAHVLQLPTSLPFAEVAEISANLSAEPGVIYAEPDAIRQIDDSPAEVLDLVPNDTRYGDQWHYGYTPGTAEGINLPPAWQLTTGSSTTVVAVIDTGILDHADLAGKIVPGYDFISVSAFANDGDGRDDDPSDPGDWVPVGYPLCSPRNSSWHGTHVAGTIGAASNNSQGVAGVNWQAKILPVRVLGRCGGSTSDIVDGARWAAGLSVPGVPANANPADVINLSLGGPGTCLTTEQIAYTEIKAAGTTVIIAAGNSNSDASDFSPGNCNNVITVAATDRGGDRAFYSNFGGVVEVSGPGGETTNPSNGILSTLDGGTTTPANDDAYVYYQGTSMATPHVAGVASLIIGQEPTITPDQVLSTLQTTARSFPAGSSCDTNKCGSGIVDAFAALSSLTTPDNAPQLTLKKTVVNNDSGTVGASAWTLTATGDGGFSGTGTPTDVSDVMALNGPSNVEVGVKCALTESGPGGYTATAWTCDAGIQDGANITLDLGDDVTCEITNYDHTIFIYLPSILKSQPPSPPNPFTNPDFEQGPTGWTEFSSTGFPLILQENNLPSEIPPHGGQWAVWLGGGLNEISYLEQTVTMPAGAPYLTFWHWIASNDACGKDFARVLVNGAVADVYDLCRDENTFGWHKYAADLSVYEKQSVAIQIRVETDDVLNSSLFVDDVSIEYLSP